MANRRAAGQRRPLTASRDQIAEQEVADALAATPAERMEAMIALIDSARRRGLCSDRRDP